MRITRLKLYHFYGIRDAMNKEEIEINFPNNGNSITMLIGANGSGKTTILSQLQPFRETLDNRKTFCDDDAYKEIDYEDLGHVYKIKHIYGKKSLSYIEKDGEELNPNGGVRSFEDIIQQEFNITKEYFKIARLGGNMSNFINLPTTQRKTYIMGYIEASQKYLDIHANIHEKIKVEQKNIDQIVDNLQRLSDINTVKNNIEESKKNIKTFNDDISKYSSELSRYEANAELINKNILEIDYQKYKREKDDLYAKIEENKKAYKDYKIKFNKDPNISEINKNISELTEKENTLNIENTKLSENKNNLNLNKINVQNSIDKNNARISGFAVTNSEDLKKKLSDSKKRFEEIKKFLSNQKVFSIIKDNENISVEESSFNSFFNIILNKIQLLYSPALGGNKKNYEVFFTKDYRNEANKYKENLNNLLKEEHHRLNVNQAYYDNYECELKAKNNPNFKCDKKAEVIKDIEKEMETTLEDMQKNKENIEKYNKQIEYENDVSIEYAEIIHSFANLGKNNSVFNFFLNTYGKLTNIIEKGYSEINKLVNDFTKNLDEVIEKYSEYNDIKLNVGTLKQQYLSALEIEKSKKIFEDENIELSKKISEIDNQIKELNIKLNKGLENIKSVHEELELFRNCYNMLTEYKDNKEKYDNVNKIVNDYIENSSKLNELTTKAEETKKILEDYKNRLQKENENLTNLISTELSINNMLANKKELQDKYEKDILIEKAVSPKGGIPWVFVRVFLGSVQDTTNELLDIAYNGKFSIKFLTEKSEFKINVIKENTTIDDILDASQGQRDMVSVSLSLALIKQQMNGKYNLLSLDECDAQLDKNNRESFLNIIEKQVDTLGIEQVFIISHNNCFDDYALNMILLPGSDPKNLGNKTIIYDYSK